MSIQTIDLRKPGGDVPKSANTKINHNFTDRENAASRLVGLSGGRLVPFEMLGQATFSLLPDRVEKGDLNNMDFGIGIYSGATNNPVGLSTSNILTIKGYSSSIVQLSLPYISNQSGNVQIRHKSFGGSWYPWSIFYTTGNTTKDANGFIKAASPVLQVHSDRITGNPDGEQMGATFKRVSKGHYEITGTTGLAEDGWYITLPNDINGNPKVAVTLDTKEDGTVVLKTYKRIFSMETFSFVPDLDTPLDIPEGRWVDLRFNELPQEELPEDLEEA